MDVMDPKIRYRTRFIDARRFSEVPRTGATANGETAMNAPTRAVNARKIVVITVSTIITSLTETGGPTSSYEDFSPLLVEVRASMQTSLDFFVALLSVQVLRCTHNRVKIRTSKLTNGLLAGSQ